MFNLSDQPGRTEPSRPQDIRALHHEQQNQQPQKSRRQPPRHLRHLLQPGGFTGLGPQFIKQVRLSEEQTTRVDKGLGNDSIESKLGDDPSFSIARTRG